MIAKGTIVSKFQLAQEPAKKEKSSSGVGEGDTPSPLQKGN